MTERWRVYKDPGSDYWGGLWIVRPPGATFERSYAFTTHRAALQFAVDKDTWALHKLYFREEQQQ